MKEDMLNQEGFFNQSDNSVLVKDYKTETKKTYPKKYLYYLRSITCATIPILIK
jgi:hypothetical protein